MSDVKQVKVDNWGIYFLQRLKHFFNRTDYCDLTLQFQDNAQLKVHRLVLSACTEYFELLERTCEMYEDCLVMPDDLQADVVVPIVNFMYTGQLEFKMDLLERLYQTSEIMNMPVLTRLLESHRNQIPKAAQSYSAKRFPPKRNDSAQTQKQTMSSAPLSNKRSYSRAFDDVVYRDKRVYLPINKPKMVSNGNYRPPSPIPLDPQLSAKKLVLGEPRPTRYELPEELDTDNIFDNSFSNISYESKPLMVHPDTTKQYSSKHSRLFNEPSSSKKFRGAATVDIVDCKKVKDDSIFEDNISDKYIDDSDIYPTPYMNVKSESPKDPNQLFDQMLDHTESPKVTIEAKDKTSSNLDHAKIISEVLKKYPHLVKSNKNIKLKIVNTPNKPKKQRPPAYTEGKTMKLKTEAPDFTYESDVIDSKEAAKLIALGAENIKGPWICLICGTPGKALHFTSYYKFRRHLVDVHNEKPVVNICEYCGQKSLKRNYLLHHLYSKHGVEPPPQYNFPKCNQCNYIALTEAFLVKHKMTHSESKSFRCNVCPSSFHTSNQLLSHIQTTGHKYSADKKSNLQCIYCMRVFLREGNLYAHLKTNHKKEAKRDGIIDDSDDEKPKEEKAKLKMLIESIDNLKYESSQSLENEYEDIDIQYQIQQKADGNIHVVTKKHISVTNPKQKILNAGFVKPKPAPKAKGNKNTSGGQNDFLQDSTSPSSNNQDEEIVMIDNNEYIMKDHQLIPKKSKQVLNDQYIISDIIVTESGQTLQAVTPTTSMTFSNVHNPHVEENVQQSSMLIKKSANLNQQIQFVVSNDEEYKALMSSNHPIIFDNNDTNKTLTVLTTPHSTSLDTTAIDLDNTQPNDMMIIQDDYPLNVNDTVVKENSNIVVVYSHPVDDQNKQYQIITTQGLGAQFVQSSAIITQNYETVTTSTPVMTAHVLDTQVQDAWQGNIHQSIGNEQVQITSAADLQVLVQTEGTEVIPVDHGTDSNLNNLPDVEIIPINEKDAATPEIVEPVNQSVDMGSENICQAENIVQSTEEEIVVEIPNIAATPMDVDVSSEAMIETETSNIKLVEDFSENVIEPQETINNENAIVIPEITEPNCVAEQNSENIEEEEEEELPDETNNKTQNSEIAETVQSNIEEVPVVGDEPSEIVPVHTEQGTFVKAAEEKIQNLTSEWSEDEYDVAAQGSIDVDESTAKEISQNETPSVAEASPEVEESIENIQQEVDKQMTSALPSEILETNGSTNLSQEVNSLSLQGQPQISGLTTDITEVSQKKISSLLNDWEDNDSQEDNTSTNDNQNAPTPSELIEHTPVESNDPNPEKEDLNKENIKSLVSDWDDDDEENKV